MASHLRKSHVEEQSLDGSSKMKGHGCDSAARGATDGLSVGAELHGANRRVLNARAHSLPDSREPFLVNHDPWFLTHHTGAVLGVGSTLSLLLCTEARLPIFPAHPGNASCIQPVMFNALT